MYPLFNLQLIVSGVPFALDKLSFDFSQYFVSTIPFFIQLTSAPLSMRATVFVEKFSTVSVTIENHF